MVLGRFAVRVVTRGIQRKVIEHARKKAIEQAEGAAQSAAQKAVDSLAVKVETTPQYPSSQLASSVSRARGRSGTTEIAVGILGGKHIDRETNLAAVAARNEWGDKSSGIPERPAFRKSHHSAKAIIRKAAHEGRLHDAETLGQELAEDLRDTIHDLRTPANRPSTLAEKRGSNPLLDTESLSDGIRYRVERR